MWKFTVDPIMTSLRSWQDSNPCNCTAYGLPVKLQGPAEECSLISLNKIDYMPKFGKSIIHHSEPFCPYQEFIGITLLFSYQQLPEYFTGTNRELLNFVCLVPLECLGLAADICLGKRPECGNRIVFRYDRADGQEWIGFWRFASYDTTFWSNHGATNPTVCAVYLV